MTQCPQCEQDVLEVRTNPEEVQFKTYVHEIDENGPFTTVHGCHVNEGGDADE